MSKIIRFHEYGSPDVMRVEEEASAPPGPGQALLRQDAGRVIGCSLERRCWFRAQAARGNPAGPLGSFARGNRHRYCRVGRKLRSLEGGIQHVLPSDAHDLAARVRHIASKGVDVVYELVGRATFHATSRAVRDGGTIVNIGAASGAPSVDESDLGARAVTLRGGPMAQHLARVLPVPVDAVFMAYLQGVIGEVPITSYALTEAAASHRALESRTRSGATVLIPEHS